VPWTQLRPHDIALDWHALTPQGLPVHPELRPWHIIQIVRLLDEALTNAVKHADARRITVSIENAYRRVGRGLRPHHRLKTMERVLRSLQTILRSRPVRKQRAACATCEAARRAAAPSSNWPPAPRHARQAQIAPPLS